MVRTSDDPPADDGLDAVLLGVSLVFVVNGPTFMHDVRYRPDVPAVVFDVVWVCRSPGGPFERVRADESTYPGDGRVVIPLAVTFGHAPLRLPTVTMAGPDVHDAMLRVMRDFVLVWSLLDGNA